MGDLKNPKLIWLKAILFLLLGLLAGTLLLVRMSSLTDTLLLGLTVWACCRFYYFAFYVIQHYVDPEYRFAGLFDFARYTLSRRRLNGTEDEGETP
ncbi:MAG: hypothetical protein ACYTGL_14395 [Planctomycetota bacterium]|jgi:hypothetical protein